MHHDGICALLVFSSLCSLCVWDQKGPRVFVIIFWGKVINVSCEYDQLNDFNATLQAAWYIYRSTPFIVWICELIYGMVIKQSHKKQSKL